MPEGFSAGGMPGGFGFSGMPGGGTRSFHFSTGGGGGSGGFNFSDPNDIFSSFARSGGADNDDDIFNIFTRGGGASFGGGFGGGGRSSGGMPRRSSGMRPRPKTPEVTIVEKPLPLTLEELYTGKKKKMNIKRKTYDEATGKRSVQEKPLEIDVKPGWKAGTKIKFPGVGDQEEGGVQDLHFIVTIVSSPLFEFYWGGIVLTCV